MLAGKLDRKITIQERTLTQNATGEAETAWSTFTEAWAQKLDMAGREYFTAQQVNSEITTKFKTRHIDGLNMEMRISYDGLIYDIINIAELGRNVGIEIMAKAKHE